MELYEDRSGDPPCKILQRNRDTKFTAAFDNVFPPFGSVVHLTSPRSPNLQAHVERVIQTLKHEILKAFCVINDAELNYTLRVGQDWYNLRRGHSSRNHLPPVQLATGKIECLEELGGHLKSYRGAA